MQQCFGGGFATGLAGNYTFTAATNWNEEAITTNGGNNFTSSWTQSAPRSEGLYQHYLDATNGAEAILGPLSFPAVPADPFGPKGLNKAGVNFENPTYASGDLMIGGVVNVAGLNNSRGFAATNPIVPTYALLIVPDPLTENLNTPRFETNIDRVYQTLIANLVPANHIKVFYGAAPGKQTPGGTPIDGAATYKNLSEVVMPAGSNLFVYTTGHGGSVDRTGAVAIYTRVANSADVKVYTLPANSFVGADGGPVVSENDKLKIQFTSRASNLDHVRISLTNSALGGPTLDLGELVLESTPDTDLSDIFGPSYYYDISVPLLQLEALWSPGVPLDFTLSNIPDIDFSASDSFITSVTFDDFGDTWSVGVTSVPEPSTLVMMALGGALLIFQMRPKRGAAPNRES